MVAHLEKLTLIASDNNSSTKKETCEKVQNFGKNDILHMEIDKEIMI